MKMRSLALPASLAALVLTSVTACGGTGDADRASSSSSETSAQQPEAARQAPVIDAAVVRGTRQYDYEPAPSMRALAKATPSAVTGEVVGWSDGRTAVESDGSGYVDTSYFAVLEIKVNQSYRAVAGQQVDGRVFVEIPRGGEIRVDGESPEGTPAHTTIAELSAAVPAGTRVIVAAGKAPTPSEWESQAPSATVKNVGAGHPDSASLLWPAPQGLIFEEDTGAFDSGMADDVRHWGWLPAETPPDRGFGYLLNDLKALGQ